MKNLFEFYQPDIQSISLSIVMLPQEGAISGPTGRPLNSFAILKSGLFLLFDSPFSWTLPGVRDLVKQGRSPTGSFISHSDLAQVGDAFTTLKEEFQLTSMLHAVDQTVASVNGCDFQFDDPAMTDVLHGLNLELIHIPGQTSGSMMLYDSSDGFLLAGDSVVGPGPNQSTQLPVLKRPRMQQEDNDRFCAQWGQIVKDRDVRGILPLHGQGFSQTQLGKLAFDQAVENIWSGEPMNPLKS